MLRTIIKISFLFFVFSPLVEAAQKTPEITEQQIYKTVIPMSDEDETSVIVFFKYSCPVCRNYHAVLDHWGSTLPKPIIFQFFPIAEGDDNGHAISVDSGLGMLGFWSAEKSGTQSQRNMFSEEMYTLYQDRHITITPKDVVEAAQVSSLTMGRFEKAWRSGVSKGVPSLERQRYYKPSVTPTMVICGKYMITPDSAMGNQDTFIQLANGLVSKCLMEKGLAK